MGEVRDAIEKSSPRGAAVAVTPGLRAQIGEMKEQVYDLIQIKQRDLEREGEAARAENQRKLDLLRDVASHLSQAHDGLTRY